jgi:hypothetical protein
MEVNHEVTHVGVVNRLLGLGFPSRKSGRVARKHADNIELVEVTEGRAFKIGQFTTDYEMEQLLRIVRHQNLPYRGEQD